MILTPNMTKIEVEEETPRMTLEPSRSQEPKEEEIPLMTFEPSSQEAKGKVKQNGHLVCEYSKILNLTITLSFKRILRSF